MIHMQRAAAAGAHDPPVGAPWPPPTEHVTTHRAGERPLTPTPTPRQATDGHRGDEHADQHQRGLRAHLHTTGKMDTHHNVGSSGAASKFATSSISRRIGESSQGVNS